MKEKSKYYTPSIEEFRVGFEFESNYALFREGNKGEEWNKHVISRDNLWFWDAYYGDAVECEFRVKYLDREDIESMGFDLDSVVDSECFFYKGNQIDEHIWRLVFREKENTVDIMDTKYLGSDNSFYGPIKNRSELEVLLKQLGI